MELTAGSAVWGGRETVLKWKKNLLQEEKYGNQVVSLEERQEFLTL